MLRGAAKRPTPGTQSRRSTCESASHFRSADDDQGKHKFRIVNARGDEFGDLWGWNEAQSLVIFEGDWSDLKGLYLDGNRHREPLLRLPPKRPAAKPAKPDKPDKAKTSPAEPARRGRHGHGA